MDATMVSLCVKQDTVLQLTKALDDDLRQVRQLLDASFDRGPKPSCGVEAVPQHPNVLDEVIENLVVSRREIATILDIVRDGVVARIG